MGIDFTRRADEIQGIFKVPSDIFVPFSVFFNAITTTMTEQ